MTGPAKTLLDKIWESHVVDTLGDGVDLLYIDRHLLHELSTPQAFDGLRASGRGVRRPDATIAVADHGVPTRDRDAPIRDPMLVEQLAALDRNCRDFGITLMNLRHRDQGIVHIIGPELGLTLPGATLVCGDSHTSTHGGLGALAFGIGTSEVEHVLATQTLPQRRPRAMRVRIEGALPDYASAKDLSLFVGAALGQAAGTGHAIEYQGAAVRALSVEERLTLCNMAIEIGARAALVAPDEVVFSYLKGRRYAPAGADWDTALAYWRTLRGDDGAIFDTEHTLRADAVVPCVTWGNSPSDALPIDGIVPDANEITDPSRRAAMARALEYQGLRPGMRLRDIVVDTVFIGSCTNARLSDIRAAAMVARGRRVAENMRAIVVPGSGTVKRQAETEGLDRILVEAGFEWREAGCSMCVAMNGDTLAPGERCVSTSNRNFEGRQGPGGRTHLASPATAAACAIAGRIADPRDYPELSGLPVSPVIAAFRDRN